MLNPRPELRPWTPPQTALAPESNYLLHDLLLLEKQLIAESFRLAMLPDYDRSNLTCELNPKFGAIIFFPNIYILKPPLANQLFPSARQLRKTKLRNRPTGRKSTEIVEYIKKSIVYDSGGDHLYGSGSVFRTVETDRSLPSYTMYYCETKSNVTSIFNV